MNSGTIICSPAGVSPPATSRYPTVSDHGVWAKDWWNAASPAIDNEAYEIHVFGNANPPTSLVFGFKFDLARSVDMFQEQVTGAGSTSMPYLYHFNQATAHASSEVYTGSHFKFGTTLYSTTADWIAAVLPTFPIAYQFVSVPPAVPTVTVNPTADLGPLVLNIMDGDSIGPLIAGHEALFAQYAEHLMQIYKYAKTES